MRRLLLDFGGVVIRTPFELTYRVGSPSWHGPFNPEADPLWTSLQHGAITERDYWSRRAAEVFPASDDPVRDLMATLFAPPEREVVRPETMDLIDQADRPAVLTNDLTRFHDDQWLAEMGLADLFDPLIDLSFVGYLKPDRRAFRHALEQLGESPENVVFVDDQPRNVTEARALGLIAVWFDVTDPTGSVDRARLALQSHSALVADAEDGGLIEGPRTGPG